MCLSLVFGFDGLIFSHLNKTIIDNLKSDDLGQFRISTLFKPIIDSDVVARSLLPIQGFRKYMRHGQNMVYGVWSSHNIGIPIAKENSWGPSGILTIINFLVGFHGGNLY